jgi:hypothetical protein
VPPSIKTKFNAWKEGMTAYMTLRMPSLEDAKATAARGVDLFNTFTAWLQLTRPGQGVGRFARGTGSMFNWSVDRLKPRGFTLPKWLSGNKPTVSGEAAFLNPNGGQ